MNYGTRAVKFCIRIGHKHIYKYCVEHILVKKKFKSENSMKLKVMSGKINVTESLLMETVDKNGK
jgi:hypothetical protein